MPDETHSLSPQGQAALSYAVALRWAIIPLHWVAEGRCSCGDPECHSPGKHPLTARGLLDATTDAAIIEGWWQHRPRANIGIVTGVVSNLVVLDIDPRHGGEESLRELEAQHGPLPDTVESLTGGGGRHLYFAHPGYRVPNSAGAIAPGIDRRGDGGYVVAPPSATSGPYAWELSSHPDEVPLAALPAWLLGPSETSGRKQYEALADGPLAAGVRNSTLASLGGLLRRFGLTAQIIDAALGGVNDQCCSPPLPPSEVEAIAHSVSRYEPEAQFPPADIEVGTQLYELSGPELAEGLDGREMPACLPLLEHDGLIVVGWSHIISGYPRVGKTELTFHHLPAWLSQGERVLYFTEEPVSQWQFRVSRLGGVWEGLQVVFALGAPPEALLERARTGEETVVILDAMRNLLQFKDESDNSEVARRVGPWVAAARAGGKTLIFLHHNRKGGGDYGEGIAGGHALLGAVDIGIEVLRDPSRVANRRLIRSYPRIFDPTELIYERADDGAFRSLGDPEALKLEEVKARAAVALTPDWQTTKDLREALDEPRPSAEQLRLALLALAHDGTAERDPPVSAGNARGKTHRWRLNPNPPANPGPPRLVIQADPRAPTAVVPTEHVKDAAAFAVDLFGGTLTAAAVPDASLYAAASSPSQEPGGDEVDEESQLPGLDT